MKFTQEEKTKPFLRQSLQSAQIIHLISFAASYGGDQNQLKKFLRELAVAFFVLSSHFKAIYSLFVCEIYQTLSSKTSAKTSLKRLYLSKKNGWFWNPEMGF